MNFDACNHIQINYINNLYSAVLANSFGVDVGEVVGRRPAYNAECVKREGASFRYTLPS